MLRFIVIGKPQPAGSKRAFALRKGDVPTGRVAVVDDNPAAKNWQHAVAEKAADAMKTLDVDAGRPVLLLDGPLGLAVIFTIRRPAGHYGTGRNTAKLKPSAPEHPTVRPDCTKLLRAVEDAMSGVVWRDDAQVVEQAVSKRYGEPENADILVWEIGA